MKARALFAIGATLLLCACGPSFDSALRFAPGSAPQARSRRTSDERATTSPIKHVVFIVQENRSFNNLFMSFPGATTATFGYDNKRNKIALQAENLATAWDMGHSGEAFFAACHGKGKTPGTKCRMDGWNQERTIGRVPPNPAYSYVPQDQIAPYWTLAKQYVLSDETFSSNLDGSFIAHQYAVAAFASHAYDFPSSDWGCEGGPSDTIPTLDKNRKIGAPIGVCFNNPTIGSEADGAGVSWRFYAGATNGDGGLWSSYQAISPIYHGPDWSADVISPPAQFLTDVGGGTLANVTWITPTFETSDHPGAEASKGPAWVASIVDAIGASKFWKSTAIFIIWDDWGGMFDPVKPIYKDYDGLGFRVPLLVVSPYAKQGKVTHVQYETTSVLRYMEDNFGLAQLNKADKRAQDPANDPAVFNYAQKPRKFKKISGSKPARYWVQLERNSTIRGIPPTILGDD